MTIGFEEQVVVVTGASRGLGRLYALDLAARGAAVVVNDLGAAMSGEGVQSAVADAVVEEIQRNGGRAAASYDSVADADGAAAIIDLALAAFGRIDSVVSNAGIFHTAPFDELTVDECTRCCRSISPGRSTSAKPPTE